MSHTNTTATFDFKPRKSYKTNARKLRFIRYESAEEAMRQAQIILIAAKALRAIHDKMHNAAVVAVGPDYLDTHTLAFACNDTIETQLEDRGEVRGPGLQDIIDFAAGALAEASQVRDSLASDPLPLPSEDIVVHL